MIILQINTLYNQGSTGKIVCAIEHLCDQHKIAHYAACRFKEGATLSSNNDFLFSVSSWLDCHIHNRLSSFLGLQGCFSHLATLHFLKRLSKINPSIIHLHNIHGSFINHTLLFNYIRKKNIPVIWTLHDCWTFTGLCPHFSEINCFNWKKDCADCPKWKKKGLLRFSTRYMLKKKKKDYSNIQNMVLVTPSQWLKGLVMQSYLNQYPVKVINNGIDLSVFTPQEGTLRDQYHLGNKFIILGVSFCWEHRKGLDVFISLSKRLSSDYKIVLVGTNSEVRKIIPMDIICIDKTQNQKELAQIYSTSDVFLNPTREDNYPTVNLEALACGTPVVTFNVGGSPEMIDQHSGAVVDDSIEAVYNAIESIRKNRPFSREYCVKKAQDFSINKNYSKYIDLYQYLYKKRAEQK